MESKMHFQLQTARGLIHQSVFGYTTKGVPGLEIFGLGKYGKTIKEKFTFLTKNRGLKIGLYRYVVGVDLNQWQKDLTWDEIKWIELPMLLIYWQLAEVLPISRLDNCLTSGAVDVSGRIEIANFLNESDDYTLVSMNEDGQYIELSELMTGIPSLEIIPPEKIRKLASA